MATIDELDTDLDTHATGERAVEEATAPPADGTAANRSDTAPTVGDADGDPVPTWDEVASSYGQRIYAMAYRLTGNRHEAEDLAQDVFVRVYRNLDKYSPGTFDGWLYRITKNLFLDRVRRRRRIRTAVVLCDVQGLSYEEIAEATGWPLGTVRSRIHRGRSQLRDALAEH